MSYLQSSSNPHRSSGRSTHIYIPTAEHTTYLLSSLSPHTTVATCLGNRPHIFTTVQDTPAPPLICKVAQQLLRSGHSCQEPNPDPGAGHRHRQ
ncbi:hypothetical protein I79_009272 [Cricetulus griseus]|uniref:Uncharacterized protein n=1 Tax=Cricetulus griseus TaxID=10029 RepID=G3HFB6_CRIGR|nr:hypothetical protein I79_009272 [Cricetulus griseus]